MNGTISTLDLDRLDSFINTATAHDPAFKRIVKSDWNTIARIYSENASALMEYSVDSVSMDVTSTQEQKGSRHHGLRFSHVFQRVMSIYALIDHTRQVADMIVVAQLQNYLNS